MKKIILMTVAAAAVFTVGACHQSPSDKLAGRVENAADNRADAMENRADALKSEAAALDNRADAVRDTGKSRADAIKAADQNVSDMSQRQKDAIVANQSAAVR